MLQCQQTYITQLLVTRAIPRCGRLVVLSHILFFMLLHPNPLHFCQGHHWSHRCGLTGSGRRWPEMQSSSLISFLLLLTLTSFLFHKTPFEERNRKGKGQHQNPAHIQGVLKGTELDPETDLQPVQVGIALPSRPAEDLPLHLVGVVFSIKNK